MLNQDEDAELVRLAQDGDVRAFEALVVKYQRRLAKHVSRYLRSADDIEDVVQEAFIRAYRGLPSFRRDSAFYTWLYRIATNCAFSFRARTPWLERLEEPDSDEERPGHEPSTSEGEDPERRLMANQIAESVRRGLDRLPAELLEAITLYEVEGKSYAEIAQMAGIPIGTVRTRIFRARAALAKRLKPLLDPQRDRRW